jgi:hypothetical protein
VSDLSMPPKMFKAVMPRVFRTELNLTIDPLQISIGLGYVQP